MIKLWPFGGKDTPAPAEAEPEGKWLPRGVGRTVAEMAVAIREGELTHVSLNRHGICEMWTTYLGKTLAVSWYNELDDGYPPRFRSMSWDGNSSFYNKAEGQFVVNAAGLRAREMFKAEREKLERAREDAMKTVDGTVSEPSQPRRRLRQR
jgi:hypothetical protein